MQYVLPCGPYSRGNQANMYLQQRITLQQNPCFASFKCTRTNLCFQHNSVIFQPEINSCLKNIKLNWWRQVLLLPLLSAPAGSSYCDRQDFLVAQICTGMQGIFYINTEWNVVPAQSHFPFPPPVFPGQWNYSKLHLCWLKQMLSYGNRRDFHTGLCLFSSHTKIFASH